MNRGGSGFRVLSRHLNYAGFSVICASLIFVFGSAAVLLLFVAAAQVLKGEAVWLFCENTHSVGCLLRRSSMVQESRKRPHLECKPRTPEEHFAALPENLRRGMNDEYVWPKVNLADAPPLGESAIVEGLRVGDTSLCAAFTKRRCKECEA